MTHAHVRDGQITATGTPPARVYDGEQWWDGSDPQSGWHPIITDPHPGHVEGFEFWTTLLVRDGLPVRQWQSRELPEEEIRRRHEQAARLEELEERVRHLEAAVWPPDPAPGDGVDLDDWPEFSGTWHDGKIIREGGRLWRNVSGVPLTTPPSGFPGTSGQWTHLFVEVTTADPELPADDGTPPEWVQPTGTHDAYTTGDRVTFQGDTYESLVDGNVWSPDANPAGWKRV